MYFSTCSLVRRLVGARWRPSSFRNTNVRLPVSPQARHHLEFRLPFEQRVEKRARRVNLYLQIVVSDHVRGELHRLRLLGLERCLQALFLPEGSQIFVL